MSDILVHPKFLDGFRRLPSHLQSNVREAVAKLQRRDFGESLGSHKLQGIPGIWEFKVSDSHRVIYDREGETTLRLWAVGSHGIVDHVRANRFQFIASFSDGRQFGPSSDSGQTPPLRFGPMFAPDPKPQELAVELPFAHLLPNQLRVLGVPASVVDVVRAARNPEELRELEGLNHRAADWLLELATSPELRVARSNFGGAIYRTTIERFGGFCEGSIKKLMLDLNEGQQSHVDREADGPMLVRGCAGSGKTTVAVHRAIRLASEGRSVLVLTYNKTLALANESLIKELIGEDLDTITVTTLDSLIFKELRRMEGTIRDVPKNEDLNTYRRRAIYDVKRQLPGVERLDDSLLAEEISLVIKGNGISTFDEYVNWSRKGRKTPLSVAMRQGIWACYEHYQQSLQQASGQDFEDRALLLESRMTEPSEDFDEVIVDEAQDFTAVQLRLIQRFLRRGDCRPRGKGLFLVGDSAQSLRTRGFSWRQAGIEVTGRSWTLKRNYRNSRLIAAAAAALMANNETITGADDFVRADSFATSGIPPVIVRSRTNAEEIEAVLEKALTLAQQQEFRLSDIAVLCPKNVDCQLICNRFDVSGVPAKHFRSGRFDLFENEVKILTLDSAKGLEFPVVFILGLHEASLPRRIWVNGDEDQAKLTLERERSRLYVGMTRAAEALYLVTSDREPSRFLNEIENHCWVEQYGEREQSRPSSSVAD